MNNKTLFIEAHKIARSTVEQVGNYQIAFKLALEEVKHTERVKKSESIRLESKATISKRFNFVYNVAGDLSLTLLVVCLMLALSGLGLLLLTNSIKQESLLMAVCGGAFTLFCARFVAVMIKTEIDNFNYKYVNTFKEF